MKKLLISLFIVISELNASGQGETIYMSKYWSSLFNKEFSLSFCDREVGSFLMEILNVDEVSKPVFLSLNRPDYKAFYDGMIQVRDKYFEWERIAKKTMSLNMKSI